MAYYEVEWTETRKMRARIQAPPNDGRMLDAAVQHVPALIGNHTAPQIVVWSEIDSEAGALPVRDEAGVQQITYEVTAVGRVLSDGTVRPL